MKTHMHVTFSRVKMRMRGLAMRNPKRGVTTMVVKQVPRTRKQLFLTNKGRSYQRPTRATFL
jgi:hypothetical protein